ncbi:septum formation family protein [Microbacterium indicum]|uniref:septum formation family protein n=1 Tax=Microbacterium indicum TaxID=358100 RepID=UPI0003FE6BAA|nr:septum formation family protein [Microbacterium indicum]
MITLTRSRAARATAVVAGALLIGGSLAGCASIQSLIGGAERDEDSGEVTESGTESVFDIQVGDCLQEPDAAGADGTEVSDIEVVPCSDEHDYEYYYEYDLDLGDDFPGQTAIQEDADPKCQAAFADFAGIDFNESASLWYTYYSPTEQTWSTGDRQIQCLIYEASDDMGQTVVPVTGSLAGAAR